MIYGTQEFAELLKEVIKDGKRHDLYELTVQHALDMSVHINGDKPLYLLEKNRPREDDEVKAYRIENHEPTTKAGADKAIKIVAKGFNPNLYSIQWKEKTKQGEELEKYTLEYYPRCNSIVNFNKDVLLRKMLADPNGLVAIKPEDLPEDDTDKLKPVTVVYGSPVVWYYDRDHYLICVREPERDEEDQSYRFEYYDKNQYVNFDAYYDASDKTIDITEITPAYQHKGGKIPVWFLGGESKNLDNGKVLYQSFFSAALPHWNLAVKHGSDLMASIINNIFPQKYEVADECAFKKMYSGISYGCRGGKITYPGGPEGSMINESCQQCFGTGLVSVKGPFQTYQFYKGKLDGSDGALTVPPVGYITVPIDGTTFLDEYTDKMNEKAMWAINMDIEEKVGENQSGVAKTIDRSAQNDTLFDIHSRVWDVHTNNEYYFMNMYMNSVSASAVGEGDQKFLPEVNKPTKFDLLTTSELVYNFSVSKTSGLDRNILRSQAISIIKSENGSTPDTKNYLISIIDLDPLYAFTIDEIDLGVSKGVIRKTDWSIHDNIKAFIDKAIQADRTFLTKERQEQLKVLEGFANELIAAEKPRVDESIIIPDFQQNAA